MPVSFIMNRASADKKESGFYHLIQIKTTE
jgi:hypothetical protein